VTKPNPENRKNCSSKCAYDCAQLQYTIQHRTVLIPPDKHHSSDVRIEHCSICIYCQLSYHVWNELPE